MNNSIAFIGGGNMATSLIAGLLSNTITADQILVADPDAANRTLLEHNHSVRTSENNSDSLSSGTVVLAVKPQILQQVCRQLAESGNISDQLFISIAAGIESESINRWLGSNRAVVRCMPNTPALVGCGATALFANDRVTQQQKTLAENILKAVGTCIWLGTEVEIDAVTAVSGSGPAYFFLLMEAMQKAGQDLGLSADVAKSLTLQTALGAAKMACESDDEPAVLRQKVTSKGGTTEQAILSFQNADFFQIVKNALQAANDRSQTLAKELGRDS